MYTANCLYLTYKPDVYLIGIHFVCISHALVGIPCDTLRRCITLILDISPTPSTLLYTKVYILLLPNLVTSYITGEYVITLNKTPAMLDIETRKLL